MEILITCPINPTEDKKKVGMALANLLGKSGLVVPENGGASEISVSFKNRDELNFVRQNIHETRIIDTARKRLKLNWNGTSTTIHFDKQAAFVKKTHIFDDNQELPPLGSIEMVLIFDSDSEFEEFVKWFTPPTRDGKVINN